MSQDVKDQIWYGLIDADRQARYYCRLADRFGRWNRAALVSITALSSAAVVCLFADFSGLVSWLSWLSWSGAIFSIVAALAALWTSYADYSRRAGIAVFIGTTCMELTVDWEYLWRYTADDAAGQARKLTQQANRVTAMALQQHGFDDDELAAKCRKEAENYWRNVLTV